MSFEFYYLGLLILALQLLIYVKQRSRSMHLVGNLLKTQSTSSSQINQQQFSA